MDPSTRFKLRESVGRDELGEVFKAEEKTTGRLAAVKLFDDWALASTESRDAYRLALTDLRTIMAVRTPPVAAFHVDSKSAWIASRWVEGQTLEDLLNAEGVLDLETAAAIICGVLDCLDELHSAGKAHGGLSPSKVILLDGVNPGGVVLTDPFQHFLYSVSDPIKTSRNDPDRFLGLPQYFSPEQAQGGMPDTRSDVYVVGLLLYQLITGKTPFLARSVSTTLKRQIYEKPLPPRYAKPGLKIPKDAETIIYTALNKDADERFQAARAFRRAINNLRDSVSEDAERTATPLGISPVGVLAGLPVPNQDSPQLDALREADDELEGTVSGAFSPVAAGTTAPEPEPDSPEEPEAAADESKTKSGDGTAEDTSDASNADDNKTAEEDAVRAEEAVVSPKGTLILSAVDAMAAAEAGSADSNESREKSADEPAEAKEVASSGDQSETDSKKSSEKGTMMLTAAPKPEASSFKRQTPGKRKNKKKRGKRRQKDADEPSVIVTSEEPTVVVSAEASTPESDEAADASGNDEAKTETASKNTRGSKQSVSQSGRASKSSKRRKNRRQGGKAPAPPVPTDAASTPHAFSEDSGELGWFAIGEDSAALNQLAGEIEEVDDSEKVHNRRFVIGLASLLAAGIFGVMLFSAFVGSDEEEGEEGVEGDTNNAAAVDTEAEPQRDDTTALAAVTSDSGAAEPVIPDAGSGEPGDQTDTAEDVGAGTDAPEADVAEADVVADADVVEQEDTTEEDTAPEIGEEPEPDVVVAAVEPETEPETEPEPEVEPEAEPETEPEPEEDPEEAQREADRARAREVLRDAQSALESRDLGRAETLFEEVIELDDSIASAHAGLGDVKFEQRSYSQAARHHRRATLLSSRNADYHRKLGMDYFRLENYNAALSSFEEAIALGDSSASRYVTLVRERIDGEETE